MECGLLISGSKQDTAKGFQRILEEASMYFDVWGLAFLLNEARPTIISHWDGSSVTEAHSGESRSVEHVYEW
jgi:hypothetical protein